MRTKIALFGSSDFCQRAFRFVEERTDLQLDLYSYREPSEAKELLKDLRPCDAILFSGSLPYLAATDLLHSIPVPTRYLQQDEAEIATTLLALSLRQPIALSHISIDVSDFDILQNVLDECALDEEQPLIHSLRVNDCLDDIIRFHQEAFQQKKTTIAITSVHAAYDRLCALNIPTVKMISLKSSFLSALDLLCQEALLQKSELFKVVVGVVDTSVLTDRGFAAAEQLKDLLHAHSTQNDDKILFYTTQGAIQTAILTTNFQSAARDLSGALAFGSGPTLTTAKENAESALRYHLTNSNGTLYLLDEQKELYNLLHLSDDTLELRVLEPTFKEVAERTALSPAVLSKLALFGQTQQSTSFTANELATHLGVSRRTAERTIKKLLTHDYIGTIGEEMTYRQGRPRAVYELRLPVY